MDINKDLLQWSINFSIKTSGSGIKNENMSNKEYTEELHKSIIRIFFFLKKKVYLSFIGNIWGADLTDMQLITKLNKGISFLLGVIVIAYHA